METPIFEALSRYGETAIPGAKSNPDIVAMFADTKHSEINDDDVPWCSAFLNSVMSRCGFPQTYSLAARSWLALGTVETIPQIGDVVVLWRNEKEGPFGHCGLFIKEDASHVWILGGNQDNMVSIKPFPLERLLGYRRLVIS